MIPVRLHLHNFLSYGDAGEPIDLTGVHVACLCGPNGHGKSALLDAMTWALWGQARSNSAGDLVRLQQPNMWVDFEFLLDGQSYRVVRKWARGKAGQSDLQFQAKQEDGAWRALTGQGVRGTQERINATLRMDYETFTNSAFILQGRADEFARKTAGDRKRILGEILSLGVYDQLAEGARSRRGEAQMQANALEAQLGAKERDYARLPELKAGVEQLTGEHGKAQAAVAEARSELSAIQVEKTRLDGFRAQRDDLLRRLTGAEGELTALRGQLAASARRVEECRHRVQQAETIRTRAAELASVRAEQEELNRRAQSLRGLERDRGLLERQLHEARHALEVKLQLARQRVREVNGKAEQLPALEAEKRDLEALNLAQDRLGEEREALRNRLTELATTLAAAQAEERRCADELTKADERFHLLKGARAICPLCEEALTEEKRKELGWKLRAEKDDLKVAQGQAIQAASDANREQAETNRRLKELDGKLRTQQATRDRLAQVRQRHLEIEEIARELPTEMGVVAELERQLQSGEFAPEVRVRLAELDARIKELSFDEKRFGQLTARLAQLATAERDLHALEAAEAALPGEQEHHSALEETLRIKEEALAEDRARRAELDKLLEKLPEVEREARARETRVGQAELSEAALARQLGAAQEALTRCEELGPQIKELKQGRDTALKDAASYEEVAKAFGRNGIQALMIENALPEIEQEANALLARMTDGQLHVQLKTQRELKSGGQAETLEIEISDSMGARRYELYSGGEAFRVNFAIRIALSKLLARRAGARLETLVIDEGFGSQDGEGRYRLVEAINAVQDDFAKILVITHIDELKDSFPTRIEVSKGPTGSQVAVY